MDTKRCSCCRLDKPKSEFNKSGSGLQSYCKVCNKERMRQYYQENRQEHIASAISRKLATVEANSRLYQEIKSRSKCSLCPEADPACLDFHHVQDKDKQIADGIRCGWKWSRVVKEMEKCVILCANCHRKLHAGRAVVDENMMFRLTVDKAG